jgi:GT2 family glycosyltransferase/glycosyltransferase involved in cell wall biosynthesis
MNAKVGIVIVSYNASLAVRATLASLRQAKNLTPHTVILVDNASEELQRETIRRAFERHVLDGGLSWRFLQQEKNLGFAGGNNVGIRTFLQEQDISHICLLNSDVIVTDYWLDRLVDKQCDIVSPVTNKADSEQCVPVDYDLKLSECLDAYAERLQGEEYAKLGKFGNDWYEAWRGQVVEGDATFFCVLLSKAAVQQIGLLDEEFFPGGFEDDDYCLRARALGYKVHLARDVFIHHWGSASFGQLQYDYFASHARRNLDYLERKHHIVWKGRHEKPFVSFLMDVRHAVAANGNRKVQQHFLRLYVKNLSSLLAHVDSEFGKIRQSVLSRKAALPGTLEREIERVHLLGNLSNQWKTDAAKVERWLNTRVPEDSWKDLLDRLDRLVVSIRDKITVTLTMHPFATSPPIVNMSQSGKLLTFLGKGIRFFLGLRGIVFFAGYPYPERQSDGYFQRIQIVDRLFTDRWRIYIEYEELPGRARWFDRPEPKVLVLRCVGSTRRRWLVKVLVVVSVLRCRKIYIHSVLRMQGNWIRTLMYIPGITKVIDIHGVVPEEFRLHNDFYSAVLFEARERLAVRKSHLVIVVSEAMKSYLRQKYRSELRGPIAIFPMFLNVVPTLAPRPYINGKPVVVYAGGLQKWQQVGKMIDAISRTAAVCAHRFYCPDPDAIRTLLPEATRTHVIIDSKTHSELTELYAECHYGFILREDSVVNHVACPTKLVEYLAMGIVPIVDSANIGDFKTMGMRFITLEQLLKGDMPNEVERYQMAQQNFSLYEDLRRIRKQGAREIVAALANGRASRDVRPLVKKLIKDLLPPNTRRGQLARILLLRDPRAQSTVWGPVQRKIEDIRQIETSIPSDCDVLLQVDNFEAGGLENVVLDLADTFRGSGWKVVLLVLGVAGAGVEQARGRGVPVVIGSAETNSYRLCIDRIRPRLLVTHYSVHGAQLCNERGLPFIQVIHNTYMWLDDAQRAAFDEAARLTTLFVAVSEYAKHYSVCRLGIDPSKCIVIPNGIDTKAFEALDKREGRRKVGAKHGIGDDDFVFLSVGSINHQKNHIATVRAFAAAAEDFPSAKLLIVGPTAEQGLLKEIQSLIADRMLENRIMYAGATSEVHHYYALADAFVSAAFFEGGPLNQLEAAKANLPAVMTNVGFASLFRGRPGFKIIDPPLEIDRFHGAIWQLTSTPEFEDRLAEAMMSIYRHPELPNLPSDMLSAFDKSNTYNCYVELIESILQGKGVSEMNRSKIDVSSVVS